MLIIALVLAVIGLAALVFAVVTSNELVAWVCIGASVLGVVLLIIDALQERRRRGTSSTAHAGSVRDSDASDAHDNEQAVQYPADGPDEVHGTSAHPDSEHTAEDSSDDHTNH